MRWRGVVLRRTGRDGGGKALRLVGHAAGHDRNSRASAADNFLTLRIASSTALMFGIVVLKPTGGKRFLGIAKMGGVTAVDMVD